MVFSSLLFLFRFLPIVLTLYFIAPRKLRNAILFFASLFFYAWGEPVYVVLMLFSTVVDYTHGRLVAYYLACGQKKRARAFVISSMVINLLLLGFFKYTDFFIANLNALLARLPFLAVTPLPQLSLTLPIGISFYTFQTMSYTIDIYRGDAKVQKNLLSFGAYVALFPQLIAGPIVQYKTIAEQLNTRKEDTNQFSYGVQRFLCGLGKKVLLANNIGLLWDTILAKPEQLTLLSAWLGLTAFAFQIYFDFSGYSDMAIGLGSMFGFRFPENFRHPYCADSISDFWRRWHISLGSWFREYVYIPLGGNRCSRAKQIRNIAVVWLLTGFWHGASWNFLIWGIYYGVLLVVEKLAILPLFARLSERAGSKEWLVRVLRHCYTLFFVWLGWMIFAVERLPLAWSYFKALFGANGLGLEPQTLYLLAMYGVLLLLLAAAASTLPLRAAKRLFANRPVWNAVYAVLIFLVATAYLVDASYNPFLYFRF